MHINYEWRGPEVPLDSTLVTAAHMSVDKIEDNGVTLSAKGRFTFRDHVEGCDGEDPWVATGTYSNEKFEWTVRRRDPNPREFTWISSSGEPLFCLGDETNAAIKVFIAGKLTRIVQYIRENPGKDINLVDQPKRYEGPKHEYTGPCLCQEIVSSRKNNPFNWNKHTNGGKYPKKCFKCSCGNGWFHGNPEEERWVQVGDPEAWHMLTTYDGEMTESVGFDPESKAPLLMLTKTLRQRGFIPIG